MPKRSADNDLPPPDELPPTEQVPYNLDDLTPEDEASDGLNDLEDKAVRLVANLGIELRGLRPGLLVFERRRPKFTDDRPLSLAAIPRTSIPTLVRQLENQIIYHPTMH